MANLFMVHLMATNLTDEQCITFVFCLLQHGSLISILVKEMGMLCPVLPNLSTANSFCLRLK